MEKLFANELIAFLLSLNLDKHPLFLKIAPKALEELLLVKSWTMDTLPKNLCIETDYMEDAVDSAREEDKDLMAVIFVTVLNPGDSDYFWMEYRIYLSKKVKVDWDSPGGGHEDLFERFTGRREAFEIDLKEVSSMINGNVATAKEIMEAVLKDYTSVDTINEIETILG